MCWIDRLRFCKDMQSRHEVERTVCVVDRGMPSADNLDAMDLVGGEHVVGARLRTLPVALQKRVLETDAYAPLEGSDNRRVGEWEHRGRRLIVVFCPERARKDACERRHQVQRLLDRLERSDNPRELPSHHGARRFITVEGDARLTVNPEKIAEAERRNGLAGVVTNLRDASVAEVMAHHHGLWQVEESFRITRHDLKVRPHPALELEPDPRPHRLHGLRLRPPPRLSRRYPEKADVSGSDPLRSRPPPMFGPVLPAIGQSPRHPVEADPVEQINATMGLPLTITPCQFVRALTNAARTRRNAGCRAWPEIRTGQCQLLARFNRRSQECGFV